MKIREGFVSNSSSTSFLVAWNKRVEKLSDVKKYVSNHKQAKLLFAWMQEQDGLFLCIPPKPKCKNCEERFKCYTSNRIEELARLISTNGCFDEKDEQIITDFDMKQAQIFLKINEGKVAYIFRIADFGDGAGSEAEASMRNGNVFENVSYEVWD